MACKALLAALLLGVLAVSANAQTAASLSGSVFHSIILNCDSPTNLVFQIDQGCGFISANTFARVCIGRTGYATFIFRAVDLIPFNVLSAVPNLGNIQACANKQTVELVLAVDGVDQLASCVLQFVSGLVGGATGGGNLVGNLLNGGLGGVVSNLVDTVGDVAGGVVGGVAGPAVGQVVNNVVDNVGSTAGNLLGGVTGSLGGTLGGALGGVLGGSLGGSASGSAGGSLGGNLLGGLGGNLLGGLGLGR